MVTCRHWDRAREVTNLQQLRLDELWHELLRHSRRGVNLAEPRLEARICKLFVNATNISSGVWWNPQGKEFLKAIPTGLWENCDIPRINPPDPVRTANDIILKTAIVRLSENTSAMWNKALQGIEISLLFFTSASSSHAAKDP